MAVLRYLNEVGKPCVRRRRPLVSVLPVNPVFKVVVLILERSRVTCCWVAIPVVRVHILHPKEYG